MPPKLVDESRVPDPSPTGQPGPLSHSEPEKNATIPFAADAPRRETAPQTFASTSPDPVPAQLPPVAQPNSAPAASTQNVPIPNLPAGPKPQVSPDTITPSLAMSTPHSFFHDNAKWLAAACVAGVAAVCFLFLWLGTYTRSQMKLISLPKSKQENGES
jgi:hypothetical protein